jgi:hypothetical protein
MSDLHRAVDGVVFASVLSTSHLAVSAANRMADHIEGDDNIGR